MAERFADASLRHLETAEVLELEGRIDDSAYHYGLVGEMALKEAYMRATGYPLPGPVRRHINQAGGTLQDRINADASIIAVMAAGRLLCEGPPEAVTRDPRVIDAYLGGAQR